MPSIFILCIGRLFRDRTIYKYNSEMQKETGSFLKGEIYVIRSSGGMMNSVSAEKNLNSSDRKEFFDLIDKTDKVTNKREKRMV